MEIHFSKSARKHKIGKERAKFVMKTSQARITWIGEREEWHWVGKDNRGLDLEIMAIRDGSNLIVIHVMPREFRRKLK